ncbi:MAG TPA: HisA/HisF-related TIM barrel protein [Acidimicrobiales bacterium]|nr:HisA/HisF-related TIM barrel protein [Acidimicrobiales bacterium]
MDFYPAIDLRAGRLVRLLEGDFDQETVYGDDPVAVAGRFAEAGARWIHVVDLDAARCGDPVNRPVVAAISAAVAAAGVSVQAGGGVRTLDDAAALIDQGVGRVVIGTAAVEDPGLVEAAAGRWPGQVAVGLDHRGGEVRLRGWTQDGGRTVGELVPAAVAAGASAVIVTDISRDGRLSGPDVEGLSSLAAATGAPLIASGGVATMADIRALAAVPGLIGVIAGKAIYERRIDVAEAVGLLT